MTKSELLVTVNTHNVSCKFRNGNFGEIQKCKDVDTNGCGYFNLEEDYTDELKHTTDNRFDIVDVYIKTNNDITPAQRLYQDYKAFIKSESEILRLCDQIWFEDLLEPLLIEMGLIED